MRSNIGIAAGVIMPTIITAHMVSVSAKSVVCHGPVVVIPMAAIDAADRPPVIPARTWARYTHASAVTSTMQLATRMLRTGSAPRTVVCFGARGSSMAERWRMTGQVLVACNCDWGCPCNFNARPTTGKCEGGWTWHVDTGAYGNVTLDGLNFSVYANWPGAIHEGNGEAVIFIDERADDRQRSAIETLVGGTVGGPWGVLGWTWPKVHGPYAAPYEITFDGVNSRVRCGDDVEIEGGPIRNPVSGAAAYPGVLLPQGIIVKRAELGATARFRLGRGLAYDHSGKYLAVGPFEYAST